MGGIICFLANGSIPMLPMHAAAPARLPECTGCTNPRVCQSAAWTGSSALACFVQAGHRSHLLLPPSAEGSSTRKNRPPEIKGKTCQQKSRKSFPTMEPLN